MGRRKRCAREEPKRERSKKAANAEFGFQPFRELQKFKTKLAPPRAPVMPRAVKKCSEPEEADALFESAMAGVVRLETDKAPRRPGLPPAQTVQRVTSPEAEALAELSDLVNGTGPFDITDTTEHIEGIAAGVDTRLLRRLRAGEFACQSHLDLHRQTIGRARDSVNRFLADACARGHRCVLIVHGRGLNSPGQVPVLKNWLVNWLARGPWSRLILAFATARPCDGGTGALYVLLRRTRRRKQPFRVTAGSKA